MKGILLDDTGDVALAGGRLVVGEVTPQTVELFLNCHRGELRHLPLVGGEAAQLMGGTLSPMWAALAKKQLESAGVRVKDITLVQTGINVLL